MVLNDSTKPHSLGNQHGRQVTDYRTTWAIGLANYGRMETISLLDLRPSPVGVASNVVLLAILMAQQERGQRSTQDKMVYQTVTHFRWLSAAPNFTSVCSTTTVELFTWISTVHRFRARSPHRYSAVAVLQQLPVIRLTHCMSDMMRAIKAFPSTILPPERGCRN